MIKRSCSVSLSSLCPFVPLVAASARPTGCSAKAYKLPSRVHQPGERLLLDRRRARTASSTSAPPSTASTPTCSSSTRRPRRRRMVMDVHAVIGSTATGFAAQAKIHTRNNVGAVSGKIYVGSKQGYPEKGEKRDRLPRRLRPHLRPEDRQERALRHRQDEARHHQRHARRGARPRLHLHLLRRPADRPHALHGPRPEDEDSTATSATWSTPTPSSCSTTRAGRITRCAAAPSPATTRTPTKLEKLTVTVDGKPAAASRSRRTAPS